MADLGSFGAPKPAIDPEQVDSFDFFGVRVRLNPTFGELDMIDFYELAATIDESDGAQASAALKGIFRQCLMAEDFDPFWMTAKRERQGVEDLMEIIVAVTEVIAERPTVRPSDSSVGPSSTSVTSVGGSSSRVARRLEAEGRPSIALVVEQAEGSRVSA